MVFRTPFAMFPLLQWRNEIDRLVSSALNSPAGAGARRFVTGESFPALNMWEDESNLYVEAELPGMKADDLDISVVGDELTLKGTRTDDALEGAVYHRRERGVGKFTRIMRLPSAVESDQVQASLNHGVLLITLPKTAAAKPRRIKVNAARKK